MVRSAQYQHRCSERWTILTQIWLQVRQIVISRTKACEARRLRVQTDNAGSENKNFYMIGLLALLVHWNWFDQVLHAFLLQGHTHTLTTPPISPSPTLL